MNHIPKAHTPFQKIAVVGSGIAGMAAAWLLAKSHQVTVYTDDGRIGGHSNTVDAAGVPVDTGFIVYNEVTYPNLTALFDHLEAPTRASEMSFSASLDGGGLEYAGTDLNGLFGQRRNLVRPRFWRMLSDLLRFYRNAPSYVDAPVPGESLADYLERFGYGKAFIEDHLLPMGAAIWSTTAAEMRAYPAEAFIRFFVSHGLLNLTDRPQWRTVAGGSREYVHRLTASYRDNVRYSAVQAVVPQDGKVVVVDASGNRDTFEHVVIATHADQALKILGAPDDLQRRLLSSWRYTSNSAVLHTDPALMPKRRRVWSSWNFISGDTADDTRPLCVSYWMNRLQQLKSDKQIFVTLNPVHEPKPETVVQTFDYTHPFFDAAAIETQTLLWSMQGRRNIWFCGSYFGHGFHEDALQAGLAVAEQLGGVRRPWSVAEESGRIHLGRSGQKAAA